MIVPIQPYRTNKPFTYMGVKFDKGDLFLPDVFDVSQHKLNALLRARNIGLANTTTEEELKNARKRIEAVMAGKAAPAVEKPEEAPAEGDELDAPMAAPAEQPAEEASKPEEVKSEEAESDVPPAAEVPVEEAPAEEAASAEEGEADKTDGSKRRSTRRS